jgi:hypothetical protein
MSESRPLGPATYVTFVYPAWHQDPHRPAVDEWQVLRNAAPYFPGHPPLSRPLHGEYDDTSPETARRQISLAGECGISVFDYFSYYTEDGFVMNKPLDVAVDVLDDGDLNLAFAMTWCIRLPHDRLPVGPVPALSVPDVHVTADGLALDGLDQRLVDEVSVGDLERLLAAVEEKAAADAWRTGEDE